ncbi:MAG: hypothetical protein SVU88_02130 [Candidatus Nanohaloarchaea archaeon]|nr:hypothetical protein [Candidatus Nanohaloarchaea archaeon]
MHCGIVLTGDTDDDSSVAFLDDGAVETFSVATNDDILALVEERRPSVVALNAAPERSTGTEDRDATSTESSLDPETASQFRSGEEDLVAEGHALLPQGMRERAVLERADHLARSIEAAGVGTQVIESNARIASERLGLEGDADLERFGIDTADIATVWEYDAVVLAIVARLHADNRCEEYGIVVPPEDVEAI